jgi:L-lactate dehydrogenase complex protein LldG
VSNSRAQILAGVRRALRADPADQTRQRTVEARLAGHDRNLVPARAQRPHAEQLELFCQEAEKVEASVSRIATLTDLPEAVAAYLRERNRPGQVRAAPHPDLELCDWTDGLLQVSFGSAREEDPVALTRAFAGVAETGTLMLLAGPETPTTLNFLPETCIVLLRSSDLVGSYEEAWDRVRQQSGEGLLPRCVNFVTGPSRTADVEQTIVLGAHGPRQLHIVLLEDGEATQG